MKALANWAIWGSFFLTINFGLAGNLEYALNLSDAQLASYLTSVEQADPLPESAIPAVGTFWSAQFPYLPSVPGNFGLLAAWDLGNGNYLLDDFPADVERQNWAMGRRMEDGGGSGDTYTPYTFDTNGLWIEMLGITNGLAYLNLHNATNYVYAILTTATWPTNWGIESEIFPTNGSVMPFTIATTNRPTLFFQAEDWTGVTENGNTTPEWWFYYWFGQIGLSDTNLDSGGGTLVADYLNGTDPDLIGFMLAPTNRYFNTSQVQIPITVTAGWPYYMAALVDDTNWADASWQPFNSNILVNLSNAPGWHTVWIGLRGLPANSQQSWASVSLNLTLTPPHLIVTNPAVSLLQQSIIEIQGYCPEPLASLTYDISNALGIATNQAAFILSQSIDPATLQFATNQFQAFDVPLAVGTNAITFHAVDYAGNTTTTNFTYILDFAGKSAPAIQLFWPLNGQQVSGTNFTIHGGINDISATISAVITDQNGDTNFANGEVCRNQLFWMENVLFYPGTNYITLTATDAAGNTTVTNLVIDNVTNALSIDDFSSELGGDPANVVPLVTGETVLTNVTLWVNGVEAIQNGDGTWTATDVPISNGGAAVMEVSAIPDTAADNDGNGTSTESATDGTPPNPFAADSVTAQTTADQPMTYYMELYEENSSGEGISFSYVIPGCITVNTGGDITMVNAQHGSGGSKTYKFVNNISGCGTDTFYEFDDLAYWTGDSGPATESMYDSNGVTNYISSEPLSDVFTPTQEEWTWSFSHSYFSLDSTNLLETYDDSDNVCTRMVLQTGGKGVVNRQNIFELDVSASRFDQVIPPREYVSPDWNISPVPPQTITVDGKTLGSDGRLFTALPDNAIVDITPMAPPQCYTYQYIHLIKYPMDIVATDGIKTIDLTTARTRPRFVWESRLLLVSLPLLRTPWQWCIGIYRANL